MTRVKLCALVIGAMAVISGKAFATTTVTGQIVKTEGHEVPACRTVVLKPSGSDQLKTFRIPNGANNEETGIMAVTLTALVAHLTVDIAYDEGLTTGCGTEPRIRYIMLVSPP